MSRLPFHSALLLLAASSLVTARGQSTGLNLNAVVDEDPSVLSSAASVDTSYRASPVVTERVRRQFLDSLGAADRTGKTGLAEMMSDPDLRSAWSDLVGSYGFKQSDLADAVAGYWLLSWLVANKQDSTELAPGQALAIRKQAQRAIASKPAVFSASDEQRQQLAETLMYATLLQHRTYRRAAKQYNQALSGKLSDTAQAQFQSAMGLDLRSLQLTASGFRRPGVAAPPAAAQRPLSSYRVPIEGLYLYLRYRAGVGGGIYPNYVPYVFLKDGTVTEDLSYYPVSDEDVAVWRARAPRDWGRWTRTGSSIAIEWNDAKRKPETWTKWLNTRAGAPSQTLTGDYRSIGGGGNTALGGDVMIVNWSNYKFLPDGTVTTSGGAGGSSGGGGTGVSVSTQSNRAEQRGKYRVDGHTIEFDFTNGRRERQWFYLFPDSDGAIGVGDRTLTTGSK